MPKKEMKWDDLKGDGNFFTVTFSKKKSSLSP
jgi:hypothetical protein